MRVARRLVVPVAAAVVASTLQLLAAPVQAAPPAAPSKPAAPEQRESLLAAQIAARNGGQRVEVVGLRTESSTTYANPDGSSTTETAAGPIRVRDAGGKAWKPIDLALEADAGHVRPRAAVGGLLLSIGGNDGLASVERKGKKFALKWQGKLPAPQVMGDTATYPDVDKGVDLVVQAKRTGFAQSMQVKVRPARQLVYRMPLATAGVKVTPVDGGGFRLTDSSSGALVARSRSRRCTTRDATRSPATR